ncbi:MAG: carboxypeptidase regulatory-like domain-containing protein [Myxococcota bacterium]
MRANRCLQLAVVLVVGVVAGCPTGGTTPAGPTDSRATISGRVVLANLAGADDMTRVRVDLGQGEGGATPEADGSFTLSDLEPDVYTLSVTYSGGLGAAASGSAYRTYQTRVVAKAGSSNSLGEVRLELGRGTVQGQVSFGDGEDTQGALVRLSGTDAVRETAVAEGGFTFSDVTVGTYQLSISRDGFGSVCGEAITVSFDGEQVTASGLTLSRAAVTLTPGLEQVYGQQGTTWHLRSDVVDVLFTAPFAAAWRAWREGETLPPFASPVPASVHQDSLPEGATTLHLQFRDPCGEESDVFNVVLVNDVTPPAVEYVRVNGGERYTRERNVSLAVAAGDLLSDELMVHHVVCEGDTQPTCPDLDNAPWRALEPIATVDLGATEGPKTIRVEVRDQNHRSSAVQTVLVTFDGTAPQVSDIVVGDGSGVINETSPLVQITVDDAEEQLVMRWGTTALLETQPWEPFHPKRRFEFPVGDGPKELHVQLADLAGNETAVLDVSLSLVTTGAVHGLAFAERLEDTTSVEARILGTSAFSAVDSNGNYAFSGIPAGSQLLELRVTGARAAEYSPVRQPLSVTPGADLTAEPVIVPLARGNIRGVVTLEEVNPGDTPSYAGTEVSVVGTAITASTAEDGSFLIGGVPVGTQQVLFRKEGYQTVTVPGIAVQANTTVEVADQQLLPLLRSDVTGTVTVEGRLTHEGVTVVLLGTQHIATTDATGTYRITGVTLGTYDLEATLPGYGPMRIYGLDVRPPAERNVGNIVLPRPTGRVTGTVILDGQTDHSGVEVELVDLGATTITDAGGAFSIPTPAGVYGAGVVARRPRYAQATFTNQIVVQNDLAFNVGQLTLLALENDLSGQVYIEGQQDHSGVEITVLGEEGPLAGVATAVSANVQGAWRTTLPLGVYRVSYTAPSMPGFETYDFGNIVVAKGPETVLAPVVLRERYVIINNHAPLTNSRNVSLSLSASDCVKMEVANTSNFSGAQLFQPCQSTVAWTLPTGEGDKTVYARFYTTSSPETPTAYVEDSIRLDTVVNLTAFTWSPSTTLTLGSLVTFSLTAGEPGGTATVGIAGYVQGLRLYDDGTHGDNTADDGIYKLEYRISLTQDINNKVVTANFVDAAGNTATRNAPNNMTIVIPPLISNVRVDTNTQTGTAVISWNTDENTTGVVRYGEDTTYAFTPKTSTTSTTTHSVTLDPALLVAGREYHFKVEATDAGGNLSSTLDRTFFLLPNKPGFPAAAASADRIHLRWEAPSQTDLQGFHIDRATTPGGPYTRLTSTPYTHEALLYEDTDVSAGVTYYYTVAAVDASGNEGLKSDEVSAQPGPSTGPTLVQGALTGINVWSQRGSPYILEGDVAVEAGATLFMGPNAEVRAQTVPAGSDRRSIRVEGRLAVIGARGTITDDGQGNQVESDEGMVIIRSDSATPGRTDWDGISIRYNTPPGVLDMDNRRYLSGNIVYRVQGQHARGRLFEMTYSGGPARRGAFYVDRSRFTELDAALSFDEKYILVMRSYFGNTNSNPFDLYADRGGVHGIEVTAGYSYGRLSVCGYSQLERCNGLITDSWFHDGRDYLDTGGRVYLVGNLFERTQYTSLSQNSNGAVSHSVFNEAGGQHVYGGVASHCALTAARDGAVYNGVAYGNEMTNNGCLTNCSPDYSHEDVAVSSTVMSNVIVDDAGKLKEANVTIGNGGTVAFNHFMNSTTLHPVVKITSGPTVHVNGNSFMATPAPGEYQVTTTVNYAVGGADLDITGNWWSASVTSEMDAGGNPKNISSFSDYYDNVNRARLDYSSWSTDAFPMPRIQEPYWGQRVYVGQALVFSGTGSDPEDGALPEANLEWRDNNNNVLGTGATVTLSNLPAGSHTIWLYVRDSQSHEAKVPVMVEVWSN